MTTDGYAVLHRTVLAALVSGDPMELADPAIDLADEYDAEAREIARRLVHAGGTGDPEAMTAAVTGTFADAFDKTLPSYRVEWIVDGIALGEDGIAVRDGLVDAWLVLWGLTVRDGAVRIPVQVPIDPPTSMPGRVEHLDCVLVVEGATAVEIHDLWIGPSHQLYYGMWPEPGPTPTVRIEGEVGITVRIRGAEGGFQMRIQPLATVIAEDPSGPAITLDVDGRMREFATIDDARCSLHDERAVGVHHGQDEDGYRVTVTVADVSGPFRRRARIRRWFGPALEVTSVTTDERVDD